MSCLLLWFCICLAQWKSSVCPPLRVSSVSCCFFCIFLLHWPGLNIEYVWPSRKSCITNQIASTIQQTQVHKNALGSSIHRNLLSSPSPPSCFFPPLLYVHVFACTAKWQRTSFKHAQTLHTWAKNRSTGWEYLLEVYSVVQFSKLFKIMSHNSGICQGIAMKFYSRLNRPKRKLNVQYQCYIFWIARLIAIKRVILNEKIS